jgi:WD40 repeat protein
MSHPPDAPLRIVLGCAPEDAPAARAIAQRLRVDGMVPWLAADELAGQADLLRALRQAFADADAVILCFSRRSSGSGGQLAADIARLIDLVSLGRSRVGLLVALKLGACELPEAVASATVIELFGYSGYERLLTTLRGRAAALRSAAPPSPEPAPPPAPLNPALALRGRYALATLDRQGQAGRLGRGSARGALLLAPDRALLIAGGGASLIDLRSARSLWTIDCPARRAALSPSGRLLAIAGGSQIVLWDLQDGRVRSQLSGHGGMISALAFSPDERSLASASHDRSVRLWRAGDDAAALASPLLARVPAHPDHVTSVAFSPDGAMLATGGADRTVRVWRTFDRALVQTLSGHGGAVEALAFSPSGEVLAAGSRGRSLRLWAARGWRLLHSIEGHGGAVEALAFSPDGTLVASGAADHSTRIWQVGDGALRRTLAGHSGAVAGVSFGPAGDQIATLGEDDRLIVWNVADGSEAAALRPLSGRVTGLAFSPDGGWLAVGSGDGGVTIHSLYEAAVPLSQQIDHRGAVGSLAFADDTRLIAAASDRTVRAYRLGAGAGEGTILLQTHGAIQSATIAPGGRLMASSDGEGTVQIWQLGDGGGQFWRVLRGLRGRPRLLHFSPRAEDLAVATEDGTVQVWRLTVREADQAGPLIAIAGASGRVRSLAFSDDGTCLATGTETGHVQLWQVADGALRAALAGPGPAIIGLAFAHDGRSLAGGDTDGQVWRWKIAPPGGKAGSRRRDSSQPTSIAGHAGAVEHLAYSPTGDILASGSSDGTVRLWRV